MWHVATVSLAGLPPWLWYGSTAAIAVEHAVMYGPAIRAMGLVQRSSLSSPHVYRRGLFACCVAGLPPTVTQTAKLMFWSLSVVKSAQASPVLPPGHRVSSHFQETHRKAPSGTDA